MKRADARHWWRVSASGCLKAQPSFKVADYLLHPCHGLPFACHLALETRRCPPGHSPLAAAAAAAAGVAQRLALDTPPTGLAALPRCLARQPRYSRYSTPRPACHQLIRFCNHALYPWTDAACRSAGGRHSKHSRIFACYFGRTVLPLARVTSPCNLGPWSLL